VNERTNEPQMIDHTNEQMNETHTHTHTHTHTLGHVNQLNRSCVFKSEHIFSWRCLFRAKSSCFLLSFVVPVNNVCVVVVSDVVVC